MYLGVGALFFDLNGGTLYAELSGTLYEGTCGEMSLITNGRSGSSRISASIEIPPSVVDEND